MPTFIAIHICNSQQPPHKPKIAKEYVLPTLKSELKLNINELKAKQNAKALCTTMYKNNSGLIAKTKQSKYLKGQCLTEKLLH